MVYQFWKTLARGIVRLRPDTQGVALTSILQDQFSGMYRGKRAPGDAAYDLVNFLINDESLAFKRGGSAHHSNADAGATLLGLFDGYLAAGLRTLGWGAADAYTLGSDDATPTTLTLDNPINARGRGAVLNGVLFLPCSDDNASLFSWGGSRKPTSDLTSPTVTLTAGSTTMTGSGTSWATKYEPGTIVDVSSGGDAFLYTVLTVDSDTQITLAAPWSGANGSSYTATIYNFYNSDWSLVTVPTAPRFAVATGTPARLWSVAGNNRAYYTDRGGGNFVYADNYIDLASASYIIGGDSIRDELCLFSTDGIWTVANTALDPVDDFGNIAWTQSQASREFILWGDPGIASYSGALVVPGVDDVCLFNGSSLTTITGARGSQYDGGIRNLYRSYVADGYQPGLATVHRSHYILPILNGTTLVDVLTCRLDHGFAWTRWSGGAAGVAYARRIGSDTRQPKLLGLAGERVTDLTGCFDPSASNATDADGSAPALQVTTRDYPTSQQPGFVDKARLRYELVGAGDIPDTFNRADGDLGTAWTEDPWHVGVQGDWPLAIVSHEVAGSASANGQDASRSWLNTYSFTAPLTIKATIAHRPTNNANTVTSAAIGFVQAPVAGDYPDGGYEMRVRFESAADTVIIDRRDTTSPTRILASVPLGGRIVAGDTFSLTVAADGTLTALVNDAVIGTVSDTTYFHAGEPAYMTIGILDNDAGQSAIRLDSVGVTVGLEYSSDQDGGVFTALTDVGEQGGAAGWSVSDGSSYQWAKVGKRRERIRFRVSVTGACASFVLRSIETLIRPSGRQ